MISASLFCITCVVNRTVAVRRIHDAYTLTQLFSLIYLCNVLEHAHLLRSLPLLLESSRKQVTTYWWLACETNTAFTHTHARKLQHRTTLVLQACR